MIHDPSGHKLYTLTVDLVKGQSFESYMPSFKDVSMNMRQGHAPQSRIFPIFPPQKALPSAGFRLTIQPVVDQAFQDQFGSDANETVAAIMMMSNMFYKQSNDFKIELEVLPYVAISSTLDASPQNLV